MQGLNGAAAGTHASWPGAVVRAVDLAIGGGNFRRHFYILYDCQARHAPPHRIRLVRARPAGHLARTA